MKVETTNDTLDAPIVKEAPQEIVQPKEKTFKWIKDEINGTKTCENCGSTMRGWAYREIFNYCPKCGARAI